MPNMLGVLLQPLGLSQVYRAQEPPDPQSGLCSFPSWGSLGKTLHGVSVGLPGLF